MFGLQFVSLAAAALLCGSAAAAPAPVYHPAYGEVVHISPDATTGASLGTGSGAPHPHINLGPVGNQGHYALAPVTHGTADHLRPYMPTPNEHGLGGITRLDHVVGHADDISRSRGQLRGARLSQGAMNNIHNAQALVQDHRNAGHAHGLAAQAHRGEQAYHDGESAHHFQHGNGAMGAHHAGQAAIHAGHADKHEQASANHYHAANHVNGPDAAARIHAQNSAAHAHQVHQHLNTALGHDQTAQFHASQGNHPAAQEFHGHAAASRHAANQASVTSITHHNSATGHHL